MELTRKSIKNFHDKYNGFGVLYVKISDSEIQLIDFNLASNGKFYTINGVELTERLNELSATIKEDEG